MYRTDCQTELATIVVDVVVNPIAAIPAEAKALRHIRQGFAERSRPVIASTANMVQISIRTVACSGQEDTVAIACREQETIYTVLRGPSIIATGQQLNPLFVGRCAPALTPVGRGGIVTRLQSLQIIGETVIAEIRLGTILCKLVIIAIAISVCTPIVGGFGLCLGPSKIITIVFGILGTYITSRPKGATPQAKVDIVVAVVCAVTAIIFLHPTARHTSAVSIMAAMAFEKLFITFKILTISGCKNSFYFQENPCYSIEKLKYFKKGLTHYFIYYLCSKITAYNLINKL